VTGFCKEEYKIFDIHSKTFETSKKAVNLAEWGYVFGLKQQFEIDS
jgi:hypothetical protein